MISFTTQQSFRGLGIVLILICSACGDRLPVEPEPSVIMPLAKGNTWIGELTTFAEDGTIISVVLDTIMVREVETRFVEGEQETWYLSDAVGEEGMIWYRNDGEGLWRTADSCTCLSLTAQYPANALDTFAALPAAQVLIPNPNDPDNPQIVEQVIAQYVGTVDSTVIVPLGTYQTYLYYQKLLAPTDAKFVFDTPWKYFVPNIGPVKIEWYKGGTPVTGPMTRKWELVHVELH